MNYIKCISSIAAASGLIIGYYMYKRNKKNIVDEEEVVTIMDDIPPTTSFIEFDYNCCKPIYISYELSTMLNIKRQIYNYYELISIMNNYLKEHDLLEFQYVTLNEPLKKLLGTQQLDTLLYYIFIENITTKHVYKYKYN